jgi:hypothetical protein
MKPLATALSGAGRSLWEWGDEEDGGGNLANARCKANHNCHNESPLYNKHNLIKIKVKALSHVWPAVNNETMDVSTSVYLRSHSALNNFQSAEKKDITD